mgnify:CR=1 FL=1
MKSKIDKKFYKLTLEKLVIGLEEPILIKGIGKILAKIDSGNGGYNVIHGKNFIQQGDILSFETEDSDGNSKRVSKKIKSTLNVNIGGGHIQERPVIELDVQFAGDVYKKIPFSVTDRGENEHKVLISKDFVGKELNALIDVTKTNISDNAVNVDYVTEGLWSGIKKGASAAVNGSTKLAELEKKAANFKNSMLGKGVTPTSKKPEVKDELEQIGKLPDLLKLDKKLILQKLPELEGELEEAKVDVSLNGDDVSIFKIIDYTGGTNYDDVEADKEFKEKTKKIIELLKKKKPAGINEAQTADFEQTQAAINADQRTDNNQAGGPTPSTSTPTQNDENNKNDKDLDIKELSYEELTEYKKEILSRNQFIFYYVAFNKNKNGDQELPSAQDYFKDGAAKEAVSSSARSIFTSHSYNVSSFEKVAKNISLKISNTTAQAAGVFVLCSGSRGSRSCEFITKYLIGAAVENTKRSKVLNKLVEIYKELQNEFRKITNDDSAQIKSETVDSSIKKILFDQYTLLNDELKNIGSIIDVNQDLSSDTLDNAILKLQQTIKNYNKK